MRPQTIREQKQTIRTEGYCAKRMRYYLRKAKVAEWHAASGNMSLDHQAYLIEAIRYRRKANWYRVRTVIGRNDAMEDYMIVELYLTRARFNAVAANFYGSDDSTLARRYAARFIESLFNVIIPLDWK